MFDFEDPGFVGPGASDSEMEAGATPVFTDDHEAAHGDQCQCRHCLQAREMSQLYPDFAYVVEEVFNFRAMSEALPGPAEAILEWRCFRGWFNHQEGCGCCQAVAKAAGQPADPLSREVCFSYGC